MRFLTYLVRALQPLVAGVGASVLAALGSALRAEVALALQTLVEHQPPLLRLVIITREDPALPLARLRSRDRLGEVRAGDLRFTAAEAAEFLRQHMRLQLRDAEVAALEQPTQGWIAGLHLAALAMRGTADAAGRPLRVEISLNHSF